MVIIFRTTVSRVMLSLLPLVGLWMLSFTLMAADIRVRSDRNPVGLNESFQLVYESEAAVDADPDFSPLEQYLDILNRSQSSNVSIINGRYSSSKTWTLTAMARQQGVFTLPGIYFGADRSPSFQLTVKPEARDQQAQSEFFTRISVDQQQAYAQQQLVLTQQLFSDKNLSAYGLGELDFSGMDVVVEPLGEEKQYKTRVGERSYLVIERSYALYPQQSGLLKLPPVLAEARIGGGSSSFFDSFGNSKIVRARSNELSIAVLPVPDDIRINPWLPAREFQLLEQWPQNPPRFVQGEPLTRTLSIKAEGLTSAQLPVLPDIALDGVKQYPDQALLNDVRNDSGITGYRVEKVALIPTRAGEIVLPAIEIPWWNTQTQSREVARIPARRIQVQPSATIAPASPVAALAEPVQQPLAATPEPSSVEPPELQDAAGLAVWEPLAISLGLGWLATLLAWLLLARKKSSKAIKSKRPQSDGLKAHYLRLKLACGKKDAAACRASLLNWAEVNFAGHPIQGLADVKQRMPQATAAELDKLDALLYGGLSAEIDFDMIAKSVAQLMADKKDAVGNDLLEPLYR